MSLIELNEPWKLGKRNWGGKGGGGLMDPQPPNRFWQYQKDTNQGVEWMELNFFDYRGFQPKLTHAKNIGGECK